MQITLLVNPLHDFKVLATCYFYFNCSKYSKKVSQQEKKIEENWKLEKINV